MECPGSLKPLDKGPGFAAARIEDKTFYSCYMSPHGPIEEFEEYLQSLSNSLLTNGSRSIIVAGDFNAKHTAWRSSKNNSRKNLLLEWVAQHNLVIINKGTEPTCTRKMGLSIDVIFCSEDLARKIRDWKVHNDTETLSDHKYITMNINGTK